MPWYLLILRELETQTIMALEKLKGIISSTCEECFAGK